MAPVLAALLPNPSSLARVRDAVGDRYEITSADGWAGLWDVVHRRTIEGCVVDPYQPYDVRPSRELSRIRRQRPSFAVVVYSDFAGREFDLFDLGENGVDGVVLAGHGDSKEVIRETVRRALVAALAKRIRASVSGRTPALLVDALTWAIVNADRSPDADSLARGLALPRRKLLTDLRRQDLPTPGRLFVWGRLFQAAYWLSVEERTVESVAYALGYGSGTSLSRAFRREVELSPTETVRRGGVECLLEPFARRCARTARVSASESAVALRA